MPSNYLIALVVALAMLSDPAMAELRGNPEGHPVFSAAETEVIARNEALASLVQADPWVVRGILDAVAAADSAFKKPKAGTANKPSSDIAETPFDPRTNPDLDRLGRSSPEAALDLFQRLKQASAAAQKRPAK